MKAYGFLIVFLFLSFTVRSQDDTSSQKDTMYIVILAGQSNMAGRGLLNELEENIPCENIYSLDKDMKWVHAKHPIHWDKDVAGVGMGISFAKSLTKKMGGNITIGLVPCAAGGTSIDQWLNDEWFGYKGQFFLYSNLIKRAKQASQDGKIIGMLWHQGESDAIDALYTSYQEKLETFFKKVRTDLNLPNMPIVAGELGKYNKEHHWDEVNEQINDLKNKLPHYEVASSAGLLPNADNTHFASASQLELGKRYADCLYELINSDIIPSKKNDKLAVDQWKYINIDSTRQRWGDWNEPPWLAYFGFDAKDITNDGFKDIISGRYFYRNPGGNMTGEWERTDLGLNVDGVLFVDVDNDEYADVIGLALPYVYWLEATDELGRNWTARRVAQLPPTKHINVQGYKVAQIIPGGKPELVFTSLKGVYYIKIPQMPSIASWETVHVTGETMDEGVGVGDINSDGNLDVVVGIEYKKDEDYSLMWYNNPGDGSGNWEENLISKDVEVPDRIEVADVNGDNLLDVIVSEERYPGREPNAHATWYENPGVNIKETWKKHIMFTGYSTNSLDIGDIDQDGDIDVVVSELIETKKLVLLQNDGKGNFTQKILDKDIEMHLGARLFDLDNDGDLDIAGPSWFEWKDIHLWRNDTLKNPPFVKWSHTSTNTDLLGFPTANVGWQSASIVFDIDKDGIDDFVIAGWSTPSMVWYKKREGERKFDRYIVDDKESHIEAGGTYFDIDGDGDLDILQGGSWNTNEVWWWENPYPNFNPRKPWNRYTIKNFGEAQHHDQVFGDFDGDGRTELVFWNQNAKKIWIADIPENPKKTKNWKLKELWSWPVKRKYEGMTKGDVDQDGIEDVIGGGLWFKYDGKGGYTANIIDDYNWSRSGFGDFVKGGRPEIILSASEFKGPVNMYQWKNDAWVKTTLLDTIVNGHTMEVGDINQDGHLDFYTAEFIYHATELKYPIKVFVFYGDGKGHFTQQIVTMGVGTHMGRLGDFDGDGDLDLLQKDFKTNKRVDIWFNDGSEK